jgi:hypothetical protein
MRKEEYLSFSPKGILNEERRERVLGGNALTAGTRSTHPLLLVVYVL